MFGKQRRLQPADEFFEPRQMLAIQPPLTADRQANPVAGNWEVFAQMAQLGQVRPAFAHIVFGMNFEPFHRPRIGQNPGQMLRFIANAGGVRHGAMWL